LQGGQAVEPRHRIICKNEIPGLTVQRHTERFGGVHPIMRDLKSAPLQLPQKESGIVDGILDEQNAQMVIHHIPFSWDVANCIIAPVAVKDRDG
jgi:hypothetical protein